MTKLFLDSCNPEETKQVQAILGDLQGQTTNPSLLIKNPRLQSELNNGKLTEKKLLQLYKEAIIDISSQIPKGSVSIEVYADSNSTVDDLLIQANDFYTWIPNAHIKFPTTKVGLATAEIFVNQGGRVNMTLVFTQEQALAVHLATINAKNKGDVFVSPFVGRLDDIGENGLDLVCNIKKMYTELDSKVEVLAASVRTKRHFQKSLDMSCDIITAPASTLMDYKNDPVKENIPENEVDLQPILYKNLQSTNWLEIDISHPLTDSGLAKFASDWNNTLIS